MAFDPSLPVNNSSVKAAELRGQFTGLFDLIQAVPAGPQGPQGEPGPPFAGVVVDEVITLNPDGAATVTAELVAGDVHFVFGIPRGFTGETGAQGQTGAVGATGPAFTNFQASAANLPAIEPPTATAIFDGTAVQLSFGIPRGYTGETGSQGQTGPVGETGPAFTNFVVQSTTALEAGEPATVVAVFDGTAVQLSFGLPKGDAGPEGAPGEVTTAALTAAINTTAQEYQRRAAARPDGERSAHASGDAADGRQDRRTDHRAHADHSAVVGWLLGACRYFRAAGAGGSVMGQSSVRKGEAGRPAPL